MAHDSPPPTEPETSPFAPMAAVAPERGLRAGIRAMGLPEREEEGAADPYYAPRPYEGPPTTSPFAVAALLSAFLLGPIGGAVAFLLRLDERGVVLAGGIVTCVGGLAAVGLGWVGRREVEDDSKRRRGHLLATISMAAGLILAVAAGAVMGVYGYVESRRDARRKQRDNLVELSMPSTDPHGGPGGQTLRAPPPIHRTPPLPPTGVVPPQTVVKKEGTITVVDVGRSTPLKTQLEEQKKLATKEGETLVLETGDEGSAHTKQLRDAMAHPLMQKAFDKVRLVRVDVRVFEKELEQLRVPTTGTPFYILFDESLVPRDGVGGAEWDENIAANMAPVLGAFVKGTYTKRKHEWKLPSVKPRKGTPV